MGDHCRKKHKARHVTVQLLIHLVIKGEQQLSTVRALNPWRFDGGGAASRCAESAWVSSLAERSDARMTWTRIHAKSGSAN
jgi:hypothetical protein